MQLTFQRTNYWQNIYIVAFGIGLILIVFGEWNAGVALWLVLVFFSPSIMTLKSTSFLSLKFFCAVALITELISLPLFYLRPDSYKFQNHRFFGFSAWESIDVLLLLGLFLWLLVILAKLMQSVFGRVTKSIIFNRPRPEKYISLSSKGFRIRRRSTYVIGIILLMTFSLPVKIWMFKMGIGITGVAPPRLPFRLSGILFYIFNYFIPLAIAFFYFKTRRKSAVIVLLLSIYALLAGLASASRSAYLFVMAPVIAFAWSDRRRVIFYTSVMLTGVGVFIVTASREIILVSNALGTTSAFVECGIIGTLFKTAVRAEWSAKMLFILPDIVGRIEKFQVLFLSSQFNADVVGGGWAIFLKSINNAWITFDHDMLHIEYLGYTIPVGFYCALYSLNSYVLAAANKHLYMMVPFAIYAALFLTVLEISLVRVIKKYQPLLPIYKPLLFFFVLLFYSAAGSSSSIASFVLVLVFAITPGIHFRKLSYSASNRVVCLKK